MMAEEALKPNAETVAAHIAHITRRWHEVGQPCLIEVVFLTPQDTAEVRNVTRFRPDPEGIAAAAQHVVAMNVHKLNAYAVVNPLRGDLPLNPARGTRAATSDVLCSFFHFADADKEEATERIRSFVGPKCTFSVMTGTTPHERPHLYWELVNAEWDMAEWTERQRRIAGTLLTDKMVVDPPRMMRLAGTINWPKPSKASKGYTAEITTLRVFDRPAIPVDQIARAFTLSAQAAPEGTKFEIEHDGRRSVSDYADILRRARTDGEKHGGVRSLTCALAGAGVPFNLAEAFVRDACPVWDANVESLLKTAYDKFYKPKEQREAQQKQEEEIKAAAWPTAYDFFDASALAPRQWIYGRHYLRKFVSVLASAGGIGKTSMQIVEALSIVTGRPLLGEEVHEPCKVWLINLEDPMEEMQRRILAAMKHYRITPDEVRGKLFVDAGRDFTINFGVQTREGVIVNDALTAHMHQRIGELEIGATLLDPFVAAHGVNENDNMAMNAIVGQIRKVADETNCAIGLVHHIRKGNGQDADIDSVRGAGSLIGAARAARVINKVSADDAVKLGVSEAEATGIFRVDDGKANLAPPATKAVFRKMIGVQIENGEWVGVAIPYKLPDEWAGMTEDVVNHILRTIDAGFTDENGNEEYYSARPQDNERWVGRLITQYQFDDPKDVKNEGQAKRIISQWMETGLIERFEYHSTKQRKDRWGVRAKGRVGEQN